MKIEEYVPIIVPSSIVRVKPEILSGQKNKIHTRTNTSVREVYILLVKDSFRDIEIISESSFPFHPKSLRLLRILSKITIVSLIEYPSMVRSAVIKKVSIWNWGKNHEIKI